MPLSFVQYVGDGATDTFNIPFAYLSQSHIEVKVDGVVDGSVIFPTSATVKTSSIPANGAVVEVRRKTPTDSRIVDFQDGSLLGESDLDTSALQNFYVMQETYDDLVNKLGLGSTGKWDANNKIIQNLLDGVDANDAATIGQILGLITSGQNINFPPLTGDALKFFQVRSDETGYQHTFLGALAALNTVSNSDIDADAIDGTKIADDAIDSEHYVDSSIDEQHLANDAVTTNKIVDGAVTETKLDSSVSLIKTGYRQTVLEGPIDTEGKADFITTGTGLQPLLTGSGIPIRMTFSDGYSDNGATDYVTKINYDSSFGLLPTNNLSYLYGELNIGSGFVSQGDTIVPPQYGRAFDSRKHALLHFDGADGSTTFTDEFGNTWEAFWDAQLSTSDSKFGSSCLSLDGVGDYIRCTNMEITGERWTLETFIKFNDTAITTIFSSETASTLLFNYDTSKLRIWLGDGSGWNIASALFGTTVLNTDQWYHLVLEYDGTTYRVYVDGVEDITVTSATRIANMRGLYVGASSSGGSPINAKFDELRVSVDTARYGGAFTPPASSFSPDVHWFNSTTFKMHYGAPSAWQIKQRLFLGEAETDATTVTATRSYAYRGEYHGQQDVLSSGLKTVKNHNIGTVLLDTTLYYECLIPEDGFVPGDKIYSPMKSYSTPAYGDLLVIDNQRVFTHTMGNYSYMGIALDKNIGSIAALIFSNWRAGYILRRNF